MIGTTSSDSKADVLRELGVDRITDYNKESVGAVLKQVGVGSGGGSGSSPTSRLGWLVACSWVQGPKAWG